MIACDDLIDELYRQKRNHLHLAMLAGAEPVAAMHLDVALLAGERVRLAEALCHDSEPAVPTSNLRGAPRV